MAILKSVLMKNGVTAAYWKITKIQVDVQALKSSFVLSPYLNEAAASNHLRPVGSSKIFSFDVTEQQILSGSLADVYNAILAISSTTVPNLFDSGSHIYDSDIAGGTII